jgi:hypothetical protein
VRSTVSPSSISRLFGFAPVPVPPAVFVVGRAELSFAAFRRQGGELALRELHAVPLPEGLFAPTPLGAPVADPAALDAAVASLLQRSGARAPRASLVLPDAWARGMTLELDDLPARSDLMLEVLRFRLRKLLPFRVEELRLAAAPIERLAGQEEAARLLVLLAADNVCGALERAFAAHGVRVGQLVNATLARLEAVSAGGRLPGLAALASVEPEGFVIVFARDGAPVAWRQKSFTEGLSDDDRARLLAAELRLTRTFLAERLGGDRFSAALLAAPAQVAPFWRGVLEDGLGHPVATLATAHLPLAGEVPVGAPEIAALAGAACREVA